MTAPPTADTAFTTRVEVRAQSMFLAALVAGAILTGAQLLSVNRELGAISANVAALTELARDHTGQLRDLDHRMTSLETRMTSLETQMQALVTAVNRIAPKP